MTAFAELDAQNRVELGPEGLRDFCNLQIIAARQ